MRRHGLASTADAEAATFIFSEPTGASVCHACPAIWVEPEYYVYRNMSVPPQELCATAPFRRFCNVSDEGRSFVELNGTRYNRCVCLCCCGLGVAPCLEVAPWVISASGMYHHRPSS